MGRPFAQIQTNQDYCNLYVCYLIKIYPSGHHHNDFMETGTLGDTQIPLHVAGIQKSKGYSNYL